MVLGVCAMMACRSIPPQALIQKQAGGEVVVRVTVADTPGERRHGLKGVTFLPEGAGMLFVFPKSAKSPVFSMKETSLALDLIFAGPSGEITDIVPSAAPHSKENITSQGTVAYVLEVPAGFCERNGIWAGDRIRLKHQ